MRDTDSETKLRIAFVLGSVSRNAGGLLPAVSAPAKQLASFGHDVEVYSMNDSHTEIDLDYWHPIRPRLFKSFGPKRGGILPGLGRVLSQGDFDIVHQHGIWQAFSFQVSSLAHQIPTIISPHGMLDDWALGHSATKKKLIAMLFERKNLRRASCLHALTSDELDSLRRYKLENNVAVIPNGCELPNETDRLDEPRWWPTGKVLLFLGRIHPKKGIIPLLRAFRKLRNDSPTSYENWSLVIAGWDDGGHEIEVKREIESLQLAQKVILPGPLFGDAKSQAFLSSDAFALTSYSEGLPLSVLEAWSYRLPVIMTDACNIEKGFTEHAAYKVSLDDDQFARDLKGALELDAAELAKMGLNGRRLVERDYTWYQVARNYESLYRWVKNASPASNKPDFVN